MNICKDKDEELEYCPQNAMCLKMKMCNNFNENFYHYIEFNFVDVEYSGDGYFSAVTKEEKWRFNDTVQINLFCSILLIMCIPDTLLAIFV